MSTARFARISWKQPMTMFTTTTTRKVMFLMEDPAMTRITARTTNIRLKKVRMFLARICFSVRPAPEDWLFPSPAARRSSTWAWVRPWL